MTRRGTSGQALVETALTLPLLVLLALLLVEAGRALFSLNQLTAISREGARRCVSAQLGNGIRWEALPDTAIATMQLRLRQSGGSAAGVTYAGTRLELAGGTHLLYARIRRPFIPLTALEPRFSLASETVMQVGTP